MTTSLPQRFEQFHHDNPAVYQHYVKLAREWRDSGRQRCGIGMLTEVLRWNTALARGNGDIRLPHQFRAYYARLIMHENPELEGLFILRSSAADEWIAQRAAMPDTRDR